MRSTTCEASPSEKMYGPSNRASCPTCTEQYQDEIMIVRGTNKGREGKVTSVYRLKYCLHVNGSAYPSILTYRQVY